MRRNHGRDGVGGWTGWLPRLLDRRGVLLGAGGGIGALAGARTALAATMPGHHAAASHDAHAVHGGMMTVGEVDHARNGFDPHTILTDWDTGTLTAGSGRPDACASSRSSPRTRRSRSRRASSSRPGPTTAGCPGPTLRVTEGERVRIRFQNDGSHPHTMHFHGIHSARMDGVPGAGVIGPAASSSTSSTPSRSAATSTTATPCR